MRVHVTVFAVFFAMAFAVEAQTRCPVGVRMGDPRCMPDAPVQAPEVAGPQEPRRPVSLTFPRFGSIAIDSTTGNVGVAEGQRFDPEAERLAIKKCAKRRRSHACKVTVTYANECVALAWPDVSPGAPRVDTGASKAIAEQSALDLCDKANSSSCSIFYSACSLPITRNY